MRTALRLREEIRREAKKRGSRPVSRVLSRTAIHLGCTSPCTSSNLPGSDAGHTNAPLFGLAPGGVYPATGVTVSAVRSYRTISPLPALKALRRYLFCGTFRRLASPRRYLAPCPVEPGLSSTSLPRQRLSGRLPLATYWVSGKDAIAIAPKWPNPATEFCSRDGSAGLGTYQ